MKLEAGMYVRFYNGDFGKVANYEYREEYVNGHIIHLENGEIGLCCEEKDFKTSNNIIDLIEVGDYVNGYKISAIYDDDSEVNEYNLKHKKCLGKNIYDEDYQEHLIYEEDIETIVTKEQFESMKYKVGD